MASQDVFRSTDLVEFPTVFYTCFVLQHFMCIEISTDTVEWNPDTRIFSEGLE